MVYPKQPCGSIVQAAPNEQGMVTEFAWSRDWRPDGENWFQNGVEYIEPLKAFAPSPWVDYVDCAFTSSGGRWLAGRGNYWTTCRPYGYPPVQYLKCYDARPHPGTEFKQHLHTVARQGYTPLTWVLSYLRWAPPMPPQQYTTGTDIPWPLIWPQLSITMAAKLYHQADVPIPGGGTERRWDWFDAVVTLYLPLHSSSAQTKLPHPILHVMSTMDPDWPLDNIIVYNEMGHTLKQFSSAGVRSQTARESHLPTFGQVGFTVFDYSPGELGGQLMRIGVTGSDQWMYYQNRYIHLVTTQTGAHSDFTVNINGQAAAFNLSEVEYRTCDVTAGRSLELPSDAHYHNDEWGALTDDDQKGWTVAVENVGPEPGVYQPKVTLTPDADRNRERVLVYNVWADAPAAIGEIEAGTTTTEGLGELYYLQFSDNYKFRGASGTARFVPQREETLSGWQINDVLRIVAGWEATHATLAATQQLLTYLMNPVRVRSGEDVMGAQMYQLSFGDFVVARMRLHKQLIDYRQAAGQNLVTWFQGIWQRMGIAATLVDDLTDSQRAAGFTIPLAPLRSTPQLAPADGAGVESHIDEVMLACGFRWGISSAGRPFIAESYKYIHGTTSIDFILDQDTVTPEDTIQFIEHTANTTRQTNRYKIYTGQGIHQEVHYKGESLATREAGVADNWERVVTFRNRIDAGLAHNRTATALSEEADRLAWGTVARPDLPSGSYVQVNQVDWLDVPVGMVFQIAERNTVIDSQSDIALLDCEGVVVYVP